MDDHLQNMDKTCVCVGLLSQYIIVDYDTGHIQDLFPYDNEKTKPIVTRISKVSIDNFATVRCSLEL